MKKIATFIVKFRHVFSVIFLLLVVGSLFLIPRVNVNYDFTKYLSKDSEAVIALRKMDEEFGSAGMAQVMLEDITITEARTLKSSLEKIKGINAVTFDEKNDYKNNKALFKIIMEPEAANDNAKILSEIRETFKDYNLSMNGATVDSVYLKDGVGRDMISILIIACVIVFLILLLTSTSWIDPLIFAIVVFGAIMINMGTNALMGSISYITQSICMVMQLALAMDYSIIMLHRFNEEKSKGLKPAEAAVNALRKTFAPISSSSLTTIAGLLALVFMRFTLGLDIGLVLAKGVLISLITTILFMPGILIMFSSLLDKTKHRSLHVILKERIAYSSMKKQAAYEKYILDSRAEKESESLTIGTDIKVAVEKDIKTESLIKNKSAKHKPTASLNPQSHIVGNKSERIYKKRPPLSFSSFLIKGRIIIPVVVAVLIVAGFIMQGNLSYSYDVVVAKDKNASINIENKKIIDEFGDQNTVLVLLKNERIGKSGQELQKAVNKEKEFINFMLNEYKYNGEQVITSGQGIVSTGLYNTVNARDLSALSGIPESMIQGFLDELGKNIEIDESLMLIDALNYLMSAEGASKIIDIFQGYINKIFGQMSAAEFAVNFKLTSDVAEAVYAGAGLSLENKQAVYPAFEYISKNQYFTEIPLMQKRFDLLYDIGSFSVTKATLSMLGLDNITISGIFILLGKPSANEIVAHEMLDIVCERQLLISSKDTIIPQVNKVFLTVKEGIAMFDSEQYTRFMFNLCFEVVEDDAFAVIGELNRELKSRFSEYYLVSESSTYAEIKTLFAKDSLVINLVSFFAIFFIIMLAFRSFSIPALLTLLIQGSIWLTMSVSVMMQTPIFFICYLVIMCIQMGATVDYAILLTNRYIEARKTMNKKDAVADAFDKSLTTILTSGSILIIAAFVVGIVSRVPMISTLGLVLSLGCSTSLVLILFALPQILVLCDKVIQKTTLKLDFLPDGKEKVFTASVGASVGAEANTHVGVAAVANTAETNAPIYLKTSSSMLTDTDRAQLQDDSIEEAAITTAEKEEKQ